MTNGTWSPLVTPKSFHCNPHASHSGLQWLLGITCEDYTNETFLFKIKGKEKAVEKHIVVERRGGLMVMSINLHARGSEIDTRAGSMTLR